MKIILECESEPCFSKCLNVDSRITIGRQIPPKSLSEPTNGIFDAKVLSRYHAEIFVEAEILYIRDLNSSNGTFVNNVSISSSAGKVGDPIALKNLAIIEFGVDIPDDDGNQIYKKVVCKLIIVHDSDKQDLKDVITLKDFSDLSNPEKLVQISDLLNQELKEIQDTTLFCNEFGKDSSLIGKDSALIESIEKLNREQSDLKEYIDSRVQELSLKQDTLNSKLSKDSIDFVKLTAIVDNLQDKSIQNSIELSKLKKQQDRRDFIQKYFIFGTILMSIGGILILKKISIRE